VGYVTHLESTADGSSLPAGVVQTVHDGRPLLVRYDLARIRAEVRRDELVHRGAGLWKWRELLPLQDDHNRVTLGESETALLHCPRLGQALGCSNLYVKDESTLPTGSFKARGMAVATSMAKELGITRVAVPTQGNAGGALAAYAARAGLECFVFMPEDVPAVNRGEALLYGARAFLVDGLIHDCGAIVRQGVERLGWFDMSTLREPYRIEGKKTMGLELAEQLGWRLPDAIFYPTGGGTGLIGMWKAFHELQALGWLAGSKMPRMFACQSSTCAPLPAAFDVGMEHGAPVEEPFTIASGLRVPQALGDFLVLRILRKSGGAALEADEQRLREWLRLGAELEGIAFCPEAAACIGALQQALAAGQVAPDERIVLFNTGALQKYVELMDVALPRLERGRIDWAVVSSAAAPRR
jgi:threonine synthase